MTNEVQNVANVTLARPTRPQTDAEEFFEAVFPHIVRQAIDDLHHPTRCLNGKPATSRPYKKARDELKRTARIFLAEVGILEQVEKRLAKGKPVTFYAGTGEGGRK